MYKGQVFGGAPGSYHIRDLVKNPLACTPSFEMLSMSWPDREEQRNRDERMARQIIERRFGVRWVI